MIRQGWALALGLIGAWGLSLVVLLAAAPALPPAARAGAVVLRTLLHTGLFIVGHDAMHRSLAPHDPRSNDRLGRLALGLYACLPYRLCRRNHLLHHRAPGTARDPDFHPPGDPGVLGWYLHFLKGYLSRSTLTTLVLVWMGGAALLGSVHAQAAQSVLLFWVLPLILSSVQLFVFGTYLPHRGGARCGPHGSVTLAWPEALSLLACFHFGYHREHHGNPEVPWHGLPACHRRELERSCPRTSHSQPVV